MLSMGEKVVKGFSCMQKRECNREREREVKERDSHSWLGYIFLIFFIFQRK